MKAYKGFNKDMTCRGFQFKEGENYHEDNAKLCESGFHACENPLDCFRYYSPATSEYHEVELDEVTDEKSNDSKICGKTLKVGMKIDVARIVKAHFEYTKSHTTNEKAGENNANLSAKDYSSLSAQPNCKLSAGESSVIAAFNSKAKAGLSSLIALANREWKDGKYIITDFAAAIVDGKTIKPDTWYKLENGKFVEVTDDESSDN